MKPLHESLTAQKRASVPFEWDLGLALGLALTRRGACVSAIVVVAGIHLQLTTAIKEDNTHIYHVAHAALGQSICARFRLISNCSLMWHYRCERAEAYTIERCYTSRKRSSKLQQQHLRLRQTFPSAKGHATATACEKIGLPAYLSTAALRI